MILLSALVAKLHRALVQNKTNDVGVSFPQHLNTPPSKRTLGSVLRLHGSQTTLEQLMALEWLKGMRDHVQCTPTGVVPAGALHRSVQRRQFKTSAERLRRRRMRRRDESAEEAATAIPDSVERKPNLPFVRMRSSSTAESFCLFIEHAPLQPVAAAGDFNAYGLSLGATIPWF